MDCGCLNIAKRSVTTDAGDEAAAVLVITAGLGTNDVLGLVPGRPARFPLRPGRPAQSKYFIPPAGERGRFTEKVLPVFAYLGVGIYGHPLYEGKTPGVKIGFYNPPAVTRAPSRIASVEDFVAECMPALRGAEVVDVAEASGADACFYDLVEDDEFILGPAPGVAGVFTGVGGAARGTSSRPGRAGCSPSSPCSREPCTTSAVSRPPGSPAPAGSTRPESEVPRHERARSIPFFLSRNGHGRNRRAAR